MRLKKNLAVLSILIAVTILCYAFTTAFSEPKSSNESDKLKIVTSFYPIYIAALNVTDGAENVEVVNLTQPSGGCVHDYQPTTGDIVTLRESDVLIINGHGMEAWLDSLSIGDITIINSGEAIETLETQENSHEHAGEAHQHSDENGHIWMSPALHSIQIKNIAEQLCVIDPENSDIYRANCSNYTEQLSELENDIKGEFSALNAGAALFHDSFEYLCRDASISVDFVTTIESDEPISAGEVAQAIDEIKEHNTDIIISESQYSDITAAAISSETGVKSVVLDSCVDGELKKSAYIDAMRKNIEILRGALK